MIRVDPKSLCSMCLKRIAQNEGINIVGISDRTELAEYIEKELRSRDRPRGLVNGFNRQLKKDMP